MPPPLHGGSPGAPPWAKEHAGRGGDPRAAPRVLGPGGLMVPCDLQPAHVRQRPCCPGSCLPHTPTLAPNSGQESGDALPPPAPPAPLCPVPPLPLGFSA